MSKKYDFFDSRLLYQFCINFRRRRHLSELLNETERDKKEGASVHVLEDNHADSPFVLPKIPPQEEHSGFQSGKCKHKNKARALKDISSKVAYTVVTQWMSCLCIHACIYV